MNFEAVRRGTLASRYRFVYRGGVAVVLVALGVLAAAATSVASGSLAFTGPEQIDTAGFTLNQVHCVPGATLCIAFDTDGGATSSNILTSSNPAAGASSWSAPATFTSAGIVSDASCPSTSLCVAVSGADVFTSINPAGGRSTWSAPVTIVMPPLVGDSLVRVSCPSTGLCVASDGQGNIWTSADPTGGASQWIGPVQIDTGLNNDIDALDCTESPSTLCVATDLGDDVMTSTNPAGGTSAWSSPVPIDQGNVIGSISCPSSSLCVAVRRWRQRRQRRDVHQPNLGLVGVEHLRRGWEQRRREQGLVPLDIILRSLGLHGHRFGRLHLDQSGRRHDRVEHGVGQRASRRPVPGRHFLPVYIAVRDR